MGADGDAVRASFSAGGTLRCDRKAAISFPPFGLKSGEKIDRDGLIVGQAFLTLRKDDVDVDNIGMLSYRSGCQFIDVSSLAHLANLSAYVPYPAPCRRSGAPVHGIEPLFWRLPLASATRCHRVFYRCYPKGQYPLRQLFKPGAKIHSQRRRSQNSDWHRP